LASAKALGPFLREALRFLPLQALFVALFVFEYLPWEQALSRIEPPDYVHALRQLPPGAVHVAGYENQPRELYLQTLHRQPIPLGYLTRYPSSLWSRQDEVLGLLSQHRYVDLLRAFSLRYLVLPNSDSGPMGQCVPVFRGAEATIWVASEDELARAHPLA